jgi:putative ABC transport system permease protein
MIVIQPLSADLHTEALVAARRVIAMRHHFDPRDEKATPVWDTVETAKILQYFSLGLEVMMGIIGALTLGVGGVGVMNIMLVSVTERTKEIGVRKAIGARRRDIVRQFLFEAMMLTFLGGVLGVLLAVGASRIIMLLVPSLPASIPMWAVVTGLTVSIGVGLIFGVWPARKASKLDPIECLRYE